MSLPGSMMMTPSFTTTSPSPPKLADFQPVSDLPSNSVFQPSFSLSAGAGLACALSPTCSANAGDHAQTRIDIPMARIIATSRLLAMHGRFVMLITSYASLGISAKPLINNAHNGIAVTSWDRQEVRGGQADTA